MKVFFRAENLKKYFPVRRGLLGRDNVFLRAVDGIDLEIHKGEALGLVGESGCGKSTIGRLIVRLIDPTEGNIWFQGQNITAMGRKELLPLRSNLQIVFQDPHSSLNPRMTAGDLIGEGLKLNAEIKTLERKNRVLAMMEKVGLRSEQSQRLPHEFSGGQRQRIAIARALVLNPELVVADEPVSALDVSIQAQVINLLQQLKEEFHFSCLFISHDLSVVEHISDRVAVMYLGKIVEIADKDELYNNPKHPYTIALLSAVPIPRIQKSRHRIVLKGDIPSPLYPPMGCRFHTRCYRPIEVCAQVEPALKDFGGGHFTACHLY
jgi:oligopeptide transport system ATP-binding protein